ncbi:MAG: TetR/AcrR family transcriptional regulator [Blastocatellia bacterium]|nr:TetR/AcrR family transcriptional regulator [Blastocatellia bacterium]
MARRILQAAPSAQTELSYNRQGWIKQKPTTPLGQRIVAAMIDEFATKGVLGARISDITRLAGTTDPTFYRYFQGIKHAALYIMSEHYWSPLNLRLNHYFHVTEDPVRLFQATIDSLIQSTADNPETPMISEANVFRIVVAQSRNPVLLPESMLDEEYLGFLAKLEKIIASGQQQGLFTTAFRPALLATQLLNVLHGMLVQNTIPNQFFQVHESEIRSLAEYIVGFKESK